MKYPKLGQHSGPGYVVSGYVGYEQVSLSDLPEGGEYGYDPKAERALVFPTKSKAEWHCARWPVARGQVLAVE